MIGALIISNSCLVLIAKGVPAWLYLVLSTAYLVCNVVALTLWEQTNEKIKILENKIKKNGGDG